MGRLWWCRPPARGSRSTSRSATAPRFCSCCSSDAAPPLHRCLSGHDAALQTRERNSQSELGCVVSGLHRSSRVSAVPAVPHKYLPFQLRAAGLSSILGADTCLKIEIDFTGRAKVGAAVLRDALHHSYVSGFCAQTTDATTVILPAPPPAMLPAAPVSGSKNTEKKR